MTNENTLKNPELAEGLDKVICFYGNWDLNTARKAVEGVRNSSVDLREHYEENGNLEEINIPGVGKKSKEILRGIIEEGEDDYISRVQEEEVRSFQSRQQDKFRERGTYWLRNDNDGYDGHWNSACRGKAPSLDFLMRYS